MNDDILQDRDGAGKAMSGKLTNKVGTDSFRTAIIKDGDTTTMLRTKGGMREVTMTKVKPPEVAGPCALLPLVEQDRDGESTQIAREYHNFPVGGDEVERRVFSADKLFSLPANPVKYIHFLSKSLNRTVGVSLINKWSGGVSAANSTSRGSITLTETIVAAKDEIPAKETREYWPPTVVTGLVQKTGDKLKESGLTFLIKRLKKLKLRADGLPGVTSLSAAFANYNLNLRADVKGETSDASEPGLSNRLYEEGVSDGIIRFYKLALGGEDTPLDFASTKKDAVEFAPPGSALTAVSNMDNPDAPLGGRYGWALQLMQNTTADSAGVTPVRPLTDFTDVDSFGLAFHGYLERDPLGHSTLWDSFGKNVAILTDNADALAGPLVTLETNVGNHVRVYRFSENEDTHQQLKDLGGDYSKPTIVYDRCTSPTGVSSEEAGRHYEIWGLAQEYAFGYYRDPAGAVWRIKFSEEGPYVKIQVIRREDRFLDKDSFAPVHLAYVVSKVTGEFATNAGFSQGDAEHANQFCFGWKSSSFCAVELSGTGVVVDGVYTGGISVAHIDGDKYFTTPATPSVSSFYFSQAYVGKVLNVSGPAGYINSSHIGTYYSAGWAASVAAADRARKEGCSSAPAELNIVSRFEPVQCIQVNGMWEITAFWWFDRLDSARQINEGAGAPCSDENFISADEIIWTHTAWSCGAIVHCVNGLARIIDFDIASTRIIETLTLQHFNPSGFRQVLLSRVIDAPTITTFSGPSGALNVQNPGCIKVAAVTKGLDGCGTHLVRQVFGNQTLSTYKTQGWIPADPAVRDNTFQYDIGWFDPGAGYRVDAYYHSRPYTPLNSSSTFSYGKVVAYGKETGIQGSPDVNLACDPANMEVHELTVGYKGIFF